MNLGSAKNKYDWLKSNFLLKKKPRNISRISNCLDKLEDSWEKKKTIASIWKKWPKIAGPELAENCQPLSLQNGILFIGASHPHWRQALLYNRIQLLAALRASGNKVRDLKIKQHYPLQKEVGENEKEIWSKHPSRTDIHGTNICKVCNSPSPAGETNRWGKCSFCRRKDL